MGDLRYAIRKLLSTPGFTLMVVLSLTLAIGVNTAIFTLIRQVLLKPLPYEDPKTLVNISERKLDGGDVVPLGDVPEGLLPMAPLNYTDIQEQNQVLEGMGAHFNWNPTLAGEPWPVRLKGRAVTWQLFDVLGIDPLMGRFFLEEEDFPGKNKSIVLSYRLWAGRFGQDPEILEQTLRLDGEEYTVVGIMKPGFDFPGDVDVWVPLGFNMSEWPRNFNLLRVVGRLRPDVSLQTAQENLDAITANLREQYPDTNKNRGAWLIPLEQQELGQTKKALMILAGAVALVLLIACANVSNLLLTKAASRQNEVAVRLALGARRWQLVRQLLIESTLLSLISGVLGLFLCFFTLRALKPKIANALQRLEAIPLDWNVLLFTLLISLLTAFLFGLLPAWRLSRPDLFHSLKVSGGRTSSDSGGILRLTVIAQVALALVLLIGAGLLIRSLELLLSVDPGFNTERVVTGQLSLIPEAEYADQEKNVNFFREITRRFENLPEVEAVGSTWFLPLTGRAGSVDFELEGRENAEASERTLATVQAVTPGYFETLRIPLVDGRLLHDRDDSNSAPVVLINESFVKKYLAGANPVGRKITFEVDFGPAGILEANTREIVGVVGDVRHFGLDRETRPEIYFPNYQGTWRWATFVIRTRTADPTLLISSLRNEVRSLDPQLALDDVQTLEQRLAGTVGERSLNMWLLTFFAGIALILAMLGVFGVVASSVTRRFREIGIRLALGAQKQNVLWMVLKREILFGLLGLGLGLVCAIALSRFLRSLLYEIEATDPLTYAFLGGLFIVLVCLAGYLPARRATKVDPLKVLREE